MQEKNTDRNMGRLEVPIYKTHLDLVSDKIETTGDLCGVILKLVGEFEKKKDTKINSITFGPSVTSIGSTNAEKTQRVKIRFADYELVTKC